MYTFVRIDRSELTIIEIVIRYGWFEFYLRNWRMTCLIILRIISCFEIFWHQNFVTAI